MAADNAGNASSFDLSFTLDTTPPAEPVFDLAPASDTDPPGDHATTAALVILQGTTEANARVKLIELDRETTAGADGSFAFNAVPLALGDNSFTAQATDAAGNSVSYQLTVTRQSVSIPDTTPPTLAAQLAHDTGTSSSDAITSDPTISGTLADDVGGSGIASFHGGLDATTPADFADLLATLQADGSFVLGAALLDTLAGGKLADGSHTLHLVAADNAGNASSFDLSFTLDTTPPAQPVFDPGIERSGRARTRRSRSALP